MSERSAAAAYKANRALLAKARRGTSMCAALCDVAGRWRPPAEPLEVIDQMMTAMAVIISYCPSPDIRRELVEQINRGLGVRVDHVLGLRELAIATPEGHA